MKSSYCKPKLTVFGDVETVTQSVGNDPAEDFVFFNGSVSPIPTDGDYSIFCDGNGCNPGETPSSS